MTEDDQAFALAADRDLGAHEVFWDNGAFLRFRTTLWVFERGLVSHRRRAGFDVYPWVHGHCRYTRGLTRGFKPSLTLELQNDEGAALLLTAYAPRDREFFRRLVDAVTEARTPLARDAVENGYRIDFGSVRVDRAGLYHERGSVEWSRVTGVRRTLATVVVSRASRRWPLLIESAGVVDVDVLLRIADELRSG